MVGNAFKEELPWERVRGGVRFRGIHLWKDIPSTREGETPAPSQVPVMNSSGSRGIFRKYPQPLFSFFFFFFFSLSHSFFLSFSFFFPFDTLNGVSSNACRSGPGQATKTVVEGYPPNPDPRVSQIRFICRIVCGLKEKWDPLENRESERASERVKRRRVEEERGWRAGEKIDRGGDRRAETRDKSWQRTLKFTDECLGSQPASQPGVDQPPLDTHLLMHLCVCAERTCSFVGFAIVRNARIGERKEERKKKKEKGAIRWILTFLRFLNTCR